MLYSIFGIVREIIPVDAYYNVVIDNHGIAYEIRTTHFSVSSLPSVGQDAIFYTHLNVREDAMELYGFTELEEKKCFKLLLSVKGIGPKGALAILSTVTTDQFALAVASGDVKAIQKAKGVGPKAAQRVILELKDKVSSEQITSSLKNNVQVSFNVSDVNINEAVAALTALGYTQSEAAKAVASFNADMAVEDMIKQGLKNLARQV